MKRWSLAFTLAGTLSILAPSPTVRPEPVTYVPATADLLVYDDALQNSFQDWSWAPHSLTNTSPVYSGTQSISASYAANYDGLWFVKDPGPAIDLTNYVSLQFAIHGGTAGGQQLSIKVGDQTGSSTTYPTAAVSLNDYLPGGPVANQWSVVAIPFSAFGLSAFGNVAFQSNLPGSQPTFYIDDLRLIGDSTPPVTSATVRVQTLGPVTPIDPHALGSNLPTWLGPMRLENSTFRARTIASGLTVIRLPGGSWSNGYNWLDCENFVSPCDWAARPTDFLNFLAVLRLPAVGAFWPGDAAAHQHRLGG